MNKSQKSAVSFASQNIKTSLSYENLKMLQKSVVNFLSKQTDTKAKNENQMFEDFFVVGFEKFLKFNELQGNKLNEESFIIDGETVNMNYIAYLQSSEKIANVRNCEESSLKIYATKKSKQENVSQYLQEISYDEKVMTEGRGAKIGILEEVTQTKKISYIKDLNLFADSKELFFMLVKYAKQAFFNDVKNKPTFKDVDDKKTFAKVSQNLTTNIDTEIIANEAQKSIFEYFDIYEENSICEDVKFQIVLKVNNKKIVVCSPKNITINSTIESVTKRLNTYIAFFKKQKSKIKESITVIEVREIPCDKYDNMSISENDKLEMLKSIC